MADLSEARGLPLWADHVRFLRRHRAWIGVLMGLGLALGYVWSGGQPTTWSATASIVLEPVPKYVTPSTTELVPPEVSIDTDAQLLQSPRVTRAVARAVGAPRSSVSDRLSVSASANTHVLHVTVSARSAARAADAANAAVAALVHVRRHALGALRVEQLRQLRLLTGDQEQLLAREQSAGVMIPAVDSLFAQVLELRTDLLGLEAARREPAEVVDPAVPPRHPDYANTEVPLVSGAMLGLLAGLLLGAGRDRVRRLAPVTAGRRLLPYPIGDLLDVALPHEDCRHAV